jgi:hypothetical protein
MPLPQADRFALILIEALREWWVTLDGKCVVGFAGVDAQVRAEKYFSELLMIGAPAMPRHG